jgi:alpha-glucosidase
VPSFLNIQYSNTLELQFEELTLDVYYKEGKENLWFMKMHKMDMITKKGRYSFLSFQRQVKKGIEHSVA